MENKFKEMVDALGVEVNEFKENLSKIKINKEGKTLEELQEEYKAKLVDMFDGIDDHTNIIDNITESFLNPTIEGRIDEELKKIDSDK